MPQKLKKLKSIDISNLVNQLDSKINERATRIHNRIVSLVKDRVKNTMTSYERLYYNFVRAFIDIMRVDDAENLKKDRSIKNITLESGEDTICLGYSGTLVGTLSTWFGLADSTIKKKKEKNRKYRAWYDTGELYDWVKHRKNTLNIKGEIGIKRASGTFKSNKKTSIIRYYSALHNFKPPFSSSLEVKYKYNEKKRPLFEPVRREMINQLLPRKIQNVLRNRYIGEDIKDIINGVKQI